MKVSSLIGLVISLNSLTVSAEELSTNGIVELEDSEEIAWLDDFFDETTGGVITQPWFSKDHQKSHSRDYSRTT